MKVKVLGTGTSIGIPIIGCTCAVCHSTNPKNSRLRCAVSVQLETDSTPSGQATILIDTPPDLRTQALNFGLTRIDAVLYTHIHADHTHGIDDLRAYNFVHQMTVPVFASSITADELKLRFKYAFLGNPSYEGPPPQLTLTNIEAYKPFSLFGHEILPIPVMHGKTEVFAYRIGDFAYATDCSAIPEKSKDQLRSLRVLILDGLRDRPHRTHFTLEEAVAQAEELAPKQTYLTHISHELEHEATNQRLKDMTAIDIELAYDGLELQIDS